MSIEISDLKNLIHTFLPNSYTFLDVKLRKLTSSGDNYGSVLLAVDILVKNDQNQQQHIHAVAKKLPQNELVQKMFNSQCTFPNEVGFYQIIAPLLRTFQKEQHFENIVSSFPKFYTARIQRKCGKIDADSLLLIKNIKYEGFEILDRTTGFNLDQAKLILEKMSEIHATFIAFKLQKEEVFKREISGFFEEYNTFVMDDDSNYKMIKVALDVVANDEICMKNLEKLQEIMLASSKIIPKKNDKSIVENEYFSIVHSDMWTNNIMVKLDKDKIRDVKFVDFQLYEFASLTRDVVFFIYSSVETHILEENCDFLLFHYYTKFIEWLKKFQCKTEIYSYEKFLEEIRSNVEKFEFFHIMTMLPPIYATSKDTRDVEQLEMDSFIFYGSEVTDKYRQKACFIVKDFLRHGWLNSK